MLGHDSFSPIAIFLNCVVSDPVLYACMHAPMYVHMSLNNLCHVSSNAGILCRLIVTIPCLSPQSLCVFTSASLIFPHLKVL